MTTEPTSNTCQLHYFNDHFCLTCECGSVAFNLLKSGKIECSNCATIIDKRWVTHTYIKREHEVKI